MDIGYGYGGLLKNVELLNNTKFTLKAGSAVKSLLSTRLPFFGGASSSRVDLKIENLLL